MESLKSELIYEHRSIAKRYFIDERFVAIVTGGTVVGPKLNGRIVGGGDFGTIGNDGILNIDGKTLYELDDGSAAYVQYIGRFCGQSQALDQIKSGVTPAPESYYFRASFVFKTKSEKYNWLNHFCGYAIATIFPPEHPNGNLYRVYALTMVDPIV